MIDSRPTLNILPVDGGKAVNRSTSKPVSKKSPASLGNSVPDAAATITEDHLEVSGGARMASRVASAAHESNGVDAGRVAALRSAIANGDYAVSSKAIAAALKKHGAQVSSVVEPVL